MEVIVEEIEELIPPLKRIKNADDVEREEIRQYVVPQLFEIERELKQVDINAVLERISNEDIYLRLFFLSWAHHITLDTIYMERIVEETICAPLDIDEKWHLYEQLTGLFFKNPDWTMSERLEELLDALYKSVVDWYLERLDKELKFIPVGERNKEFVLVTTGQFLGIQHGPTKTTLDRCRILISDLGKDVLLVNSGTVIPWYRIVPMVKMTIGSYLDKYSNADCISYENVDVPYWQMENRLPTLSEMRKLVDIVIENKPYQIVSIGNGFIEEILCRLIPTIHISLTPSKMGRTFVQYQQIGRRVNQKDRLVLEHRGISERHIVSDVFTSHLQPQFSHANRSELGLPSTGRIAVIVGGRLSSEVTEDFLLMVKPCMEQGMYLLILGDVSSKEEEFRNVLGDASERLVLPGAVEDPLAYLDHCFIYLNPKRIGGGTSSVEAMSKGVPPITIRYGDVYTNVGESFAVSDYGEMKNMIIKYLCDNDFYSKQSKTAVERSKIMLDSSSAFIRVMEEYEKRMIEDEV